MAENYKNVFVSHFGKDDEHVQNLKKLLFNKDYTLRNSSIDSTKPNDAKNDHYIKYNLLKPGIQWASTCIVLIGPETHKRHWVNWEIEQAFKLGKKIIGVFLNGAKDSDIPDNLEKYGCGTVVGWHGDSIIGAIEGQPNWCNPDGTPRISGPYTPIHGVC
jgi:hypothetical protein